MAKRVVLTLMEGSFELGFPVILRITNHDALAETEIQIVGKLPPAPNILELFRDWRSSYHQMVMSHSRLTPKLAQVTNFSCCSSGLKLGSGINDWLNSGFRDWQKIRDGLQQNLKKTDEIHLLIQTNDFVLWQLPWHLWDLIEDYPLAEVALSAPSAIVATSSGTPRSRQQVLILAILGNSNGINVQKDRQLLENLPDAEVTFLVEPQPGDISDSLWEQPWDILFFAGHSRTEDEKGRIYINQTDSLTIDELGYALRNAVANGLQLAIFNSCDGLGLAKELEQLQIGQMIVMRESVPDLVAQKFLQHFLEALVRQDSSYLAHREARQRLEPMEQQFPGATWLPVMYQNLVTSPVTWSGLRGTSGGRIASSRRTFTRHSVEQQLLDDVHLEVESRLCSSLHRAVFINLRKEKQLTLVKRLWDVEVKIGHKPSTQLPPQTSIIEVFDHFEVAGRLLILGQPGSGKTTTLLELARELIFRSQTTPEKPIPVLLNLSSWKDNRQSLTDWLVAELKLKYGVRVDISRQWLVSRQLLPLLDGLDELESTGQTLCIQAINQFQQDYRPQHLVVCSRLVEYELCHTQLQLNAAIRLLPLCEEQIRTYLVSAKRKQLWQSILEVPSLMSMARSPLLLSIITLTLQEQAIQEWQKFSSDEERLRYLFNAYIEQMLSRQITQRWYCSHFEPTAKQTMHWLRWLATSLKSESQTEFLIEKMQPSCLPTPTSLRLYLYGVGLIFWLIVGLIYGLKDGLYFGLSHGLSAGLKYGLKEGLIIVLIAGLFNGLIAKLNPNLITGLILGPIGVQIGNHIFGLISGEMTNPWTDNLMYGLFFGLLGGTILELSKKIRTVETLKWSKTNVRSGLIFGLMFGLMFGLSIPAKGISGLFLVLIYKLIAGLVYGMIGGMIGALIRGLSGPDIEKRTVPNQGIWLCAVNAGIFALIGGLTLGLITGLLTVNNGKSLTYWLYNITQGVLLGGLVGGIVPGFACIQHFTLRFILWRNGSIPWNYARFLNYATDRMFLQRVGGRYRFIHDLLRSHFAQMSLD